MKQSRKSHRYVVIMAGGGGTRLWPLSRKNKPKQFHPLLSSTTLLQETYRRMKKVVPKENIYISTSIDYFDIILAQIPELGEDHLILEPVARNTAPAIGLVAHRILQHDEEAIVATIAADHAIGDINEYTRALKSSLSFASNHQDKIVLLGIIPKRPDTGLGYIERGRILDRSETHKAYVINNFKEKPDEKTAKRYLKSGKFLWNAGYFVFSAKTMTELFSEFLPETSEKLQQLVSMRTSTKNIKQYLLRARKIFKTITSEPIDTALIERLDPKQRMVVPTELEWSDIGNWKTLVEFIQSKKTNGDVNHIDHLCKNCYVRTSPNKIIATLGVTDVVIIDTPDALLVADQNKAHEIKKIVAEIEKRKKKKYL